MPSYTPEQIEGQGYKNTTQDIIDLLKSSVDLQTATMLEYEEAETLVAALEAAEKERDALAAYAAKLEKAGDDMRESSDGSILHCDAIRDWDAARKEKP